MSLSLFFSIYMYTMVILHPIEEIWNYNNPRPWPKKQYMLLNWDKSDFKTVNGELSLMKIDMHDSSIKAKARDRYWKFHF